MNKKKLFLLLGSIVALSACSKNTQSDWNPYICPADFVGYESLANRARKDTYSTYLSYMPSTLNYTTTMQSENAEHIANFVDGLVEHDRFGNLVPCLATDTGKSNSSYDEWTFTVKSGIKWVRDNGEVYKNAAGVEQEVKAEDFRSILRVVLDSATASESAYLPMLIIKGAQQYNIATSTAQEAKDDSHEVRNNKIFNALRKANLLDGATIDDIDDILDFKKVGVEVDAQKNEIKYILSQPADYFPTMLTYLPFLPLNYEYYQEVGATIFGSQKNLLFCGAYLIKERSNVKLSYEANPYYWDKDSVKTKYINYTILSSNVAEDFARNEYEKGNIDGFTVTSNDEEGWKKYVEGPDGKGTITDPHNDYAYSQEGQGDKSSFFFYLNQNRREIDSTLSSVSKAQIQNANKAYKYSYFRKALFNALDLEAYNARNGATEQEQHQYQINTYTPKYFVTDNSGKDFYEYLVDAYADKHNVSTSQADKILSPGTINQSSLEQSVKDVNDAITQLKQDNPSITYPIVVEYTSLYGDTTQRYYDDLFVEYTNERLNGCIVNEEYSDPNNEKGLKVCSASDKKVVLQANNKVASNQNYIEISNSKNYSLFIAGWGPDYGDPMTYAHTTVKDGDLSDSLGTQSSAKLSTETEEKLAHYQELVDAANSIVSTTDEKKVERYKKFAEAEIYMLEELSLLKPLYQRGQGYSVTISKFIPYRSPRAGYGLSSDKLKGMEILKDDALKACERKVIREEWDKEKAQAK